MRRALGLPAGALAVVAVAALVAPTNPSAMASRALRSGAQDVVVGPATTVGPSVSAVANTMPPTQPSMTSTPATVELRVATKEATTATAPPPRPSVVDTHSAAPDLLAPSARTLPVAVRLEGTGIAGPIVPTGVDAGSGEFTVPPDAGLVGWYQYGPKPGEAGSAVLAGHLDWKHRLGVFNRLIDVPIGTIVTVTFADRTVRRFRITDTRLVLKPQLPTAQVFARAGTPVLRLITCGGEYDRSTHHYRSNILVTAVPIA